MFLLRVVFLVVILFPQLGFSQKQIMDSEKSIASYLIVGDNQFILRHVTRSDSCPTVTWSSSKSQLMQLRVSSNTLPLREKRDVIPSVFSELVCEAVWPVSETSAEVNGMHFNKPSQYPKKILLIGDTGCRMKASEDAFQDCYDEDKWPFKRIILSGSQLKPDLVVHVGDIHYRESPCPVGRMGCQGSSWGYGLDAWIEDFFLPFKELASTPWVFIRGNHENCARAGQGWHRYIDINPYTEETSCNDVKNDIKGNFSTPYSVELAKQAQLIVFDSSNTPSKPMQKSNEMYETYQQQVKDAEKLSMNKKFNIFGNHHPINAYTFDKKTSSAKEYVSGLTGVLRGVNKDELLPTFSMTLHGHTHFFESISYTNGRPLTLVTGNGGSSLEGSAIEQISFTESQKSDYSILNFKASETFGFALLERQDMDGESWLLTEYDQFGKPKFHCNITNKKSVCSE